MRKYGIWIMIFVFFAACNVYAATNLYEKYAKNKAVKIFLNNVVNDTGKPDASVDVFKKAFKDELAGRMSVKLESAASQADADVVVDAKIKSFEFKSRVLPRFTGAETLAADMTAPKSYAKLIVEYTVTSVKTGKELLKYPNFTTEELRPVAHMEGEKGYMWGISLNIKRFVYRAFCKQKNARS
ncbi:MAG: hypothetical protein PHS37_01605 [Candidatus Omnitrophica bacterium]|nr:hypothetical protein [Candidatus Omnitrophota bacterium]